MVSLFLRSHTHRSFTYHAFNLLSPLLMFLLYLAVLLLFLFFCLIAELRLTRFSNKYSERPNIPPPPQPELVLGRFRLEMWTCPVTRL